LHGDDGARSPVTNNLVQYAAFIREPLAFAEWQGGKDRTRETVGDIESRRTIGTVAATLVCDREIRTVGSADIADCIQRFRPCVTGQSRQVASESLGQLRAESV